MLSLIFRRSKGYAEGKYFLMFVSCAGLNLPQQGPVVHFCDGHKASGLTSNEILFVG
jgi:hypothetical protein